MTVNTNEKKIKEEIPIARHTKIELIDVLKETVTKVVRQAGSFKNCKYADIRLGIHEAKYAHVENGKLKSRRLSEGGEEVVLAPDVVV